MGQYIKSVFDLPSSVVLALYESLVECATLCVKSWVILQCHRAAAAMQPAFPSLVRHPYFIILKPRIHEESNWTSHMIKYVCTAENCCPLEFIQGNIHKRRPTYGLAVFDRPIVTGQIIVKIK